MEAPGTPDPPLARASSSTPKKWDDSDTVLTRLAKDYSHTNHKLDSNLEMVEDWEKLKKKALLRSKTGGAAGCWAQIMRGKGFTAPGAEDEHEGDHVNLFLDLDDRLPTLKEAQEKTDQMVKWALEELPGLLEPYGVKPTEDWVKDNIAISTMPGKDPEYKQEIAELRKEANAAVKEGNQEKEKEFEEKIERKKKAKYKASAHVCVNGTILEWCSHKQFLEKSGLIKAAPLAADPMKKEGKTVLDTTIYSVNRPLRLINNSKPGDPERFKKAVACVNSNELRKHLPNYIAGDVVPVDLNAEKVEEEEGKKEKKVKKKTKEEDDDFGMNVWHKKDAEMRDEENTARTREAEALLLLCDPNMDYGDWLSVSSLFKKECAHLDDGGRAVWDEWHKSYKGVWKVSEDDDWKKLHDADNLEMGTLHHFAKKGPGGLLAYDECQRSLRKALEDCNPALLTAIDHVPYVLDTLEPVKYCKASNTLFKWDRRTGIWGDWDESKLQHHLATGYRATVRQASRVWEMKFLEAKKVDEFEDLDENQKKQYASRKKAWFGVEQNLGNNKEPLPAIIKLLLSDPMVYTAAAQATWNDNREMQLNFIFPFKNGIIDLNDDYPQELQVAPRELNIIHSEKIRGTTGYNFKQDWPTKEEDMKEVDKFLRSCRMSDEEHKYCLMKDSSALLGSNIHEEFEIWTGVTSNGKTKTQTVAERAFGDLAGRLEPVFFQKARSNPNEASGYLAKLKFCRVLFSTEPENEQWVILPGRVKKITGRDWIECRGNYKDSGEFLPMFAPILVMNDVLKMKDEPAIRRRLVYRKFNKCFDASQLAERQAEDPEVVYEEPQWSDSDITRLVSSDRWRHAYIHLMLKSYSEYKGEIGRLTHSYDSTNFPAAWRGAAVAYLQTSDEQMVFLKETFLLTHDEKWIKREKKIISSNQIDTPAQPFGNTMSKKELERAKKAEDDIDGTEHKIQQKGEESAMWEMYVAYCDRQNVNKSKRGPDEKLFAKLRAVGAGQDRDRNGDMIFTGVLAKNSAKGQRLLERGEAYEIAPATGEPVEDSEGDIFDEKGNADVVFRDDKDDIVEKEKEKILEKMKKEEEEKEKEKEPDPPPSEPEPFEPEPEPFSSPSEPEPEPPFSSSSSDEDDKKEEKEGKKKPVIPEGYTELEVEGEDYLEHEETGKIYSMDLEELIGEFDGDNDLQPATKKEKKAYVKARKERKQAEYAIVDTDEEEAGE